MTKVRDDYFKARKSMFDPVDMGELIDEMDDAQGVEKAVLMDNIDQAVGDCPQFVEARPDRSALAMGGINLLSPMPSLRADRRRRRPAGGVCRCGTELLGRRTVSAERRRVLSAVHWCA